MKPRALGPSYGIIYCAQSTCYEHLPASTGELINTGLCPVNSTERSGAAPSPSVLRYPDLAICHTCLNPGHFVLVVQTRSGSSGTGNVPVCRQVWVSSHNGEKRLPHP